MTDSNSEKKTYGDGTESESPPLKKQHKSVAFEEDNEDDEDFPKTLEGFGYRFNEFGQLRHIETGVLYQFQEKEDDHDYNQRRYEVLGELITEYVYDLVIKEGKLKTAKVPIDASESEPSTFIFHSEDAFTNPERLVLLIHGSGVVRAGQWARRLIINDCINSGTQLPFIKRAQGLGYGVLVLNTNDNFREENGTKKTIRGSENPEKHTNYVWEYFVEKASAKHVAIIAHSYGGVVTINLLNSYQRSFQNRVFAVAFTDSVHSLRHQGTPSHLIRWLQKVSRNWVSSHQPLDTQLSEGDGREIPCVSAGHQRHEMTSWSSFASIFEFLDQKYRETITMPLESDGQRGSREEL